MILSVYRKAVSLDLEVSRSFRAHNSTRTHSHCYAAQQLSFSNKSLSIFFTLINFTPKIPVQQQVEENPIPLAFFQRTKRHQKQSVAGT